MRIGIIGAGKVGTAFGRVLIEKGLDVVAVASRRQESLDTARSYIGDNARYTADNGQVARMADVVAVTTQDREIRSVAAEIAAMEGRLDGKLFFHTSGAHTSSELSPLKEKGALVGSLHPLQTFPDIDSGIRALPETYIFIEGDRSALPLLETLGSHLGAQVLSIASKDKVLYHLSAVFVCNLLASLFYTAEGIVTRLGIGLEPFYPIIKATLRNIEAKGPLLSLTGPVVRGDAGTVASHLDAIKGMALQEEVYKSLSLAALEMARKRGTLTGEQTKSLEELLEG